MKYQQRWFDGVKLNLSLLQQMLNGGESFNISSNEHERLMGREMPKTIRYLCNDSPVAKEAREHGFTVSVTTMQVNERIIHFEKRE